MSNVIQLHTPDEVLTPGERGWRADVSELGLRLCEPLMGHLERNRGHFLSPKWQGVLMALNAVAVEAKEDRKAAQ